MFLPWEGLQEHQEPGGPAMRIVIAVVVVTFFILYEQLYNDWDMTEATIKEISRLWNMLGL
jgi:hypothetical protein